MSDHYPLQQVGIPYLFFNVGRDRYYHTPADPPEKLDYTKMVALADYVTVLVGELSGRDTFTYTEVACDDDATLTTLVQLGRHAGSLARKPRQTMALVDKLEDHISGQNQLTSGDRGALRATLLAMKEALR